MAWDSVPAAFAMHPPGPRPVGWSGPGPCGPCPCGPAQGQCCGQGCGHPCVPFGFTGPLGAQLGPQMCGMGQLVCQAPGPFALPCSPALIYSGSANMIAGMPWVAPRRPDPPEPADAKEHNEWNSDDEEIDEFGRKKRRAGAGSARDAGESTPSKASKGALSAKQQAALDRLRGRCRPRAEKPEVRHESAERPASRRSRSRTPPPV
mmetsp:Transcript_15783/g.43049  ORF Transcript_15783/g.43049 Transcript_15783/m.43049 type:complete len:206 (-) Transcript_15783:117-734(-)